MEKQIEVQNINSPAEMIRMAVSGGADLEKLEKLLALQERYEANEAKKAYHAAMAQFKENAPKIDKDRAVSFGNTHYNHASLANVVDKIGAELSKHGLSASWTTEQNGTIKVTCKITHVKGHSEETAISAPSDKSGSKNDIQAIGSTITYLQRYTLLALTGLATSEMDNDAHGASEVIDEKQLSQLFDLIDNNKVKKESFLKYLKVEKLEDLLKSDFNKALVAVQNIIKNGKPA